MDAAKMKEGLTNFGWNLYRSVAEKGENVFISPHSVVSAIMLACLGARGATADQILKGIAAEIEEREKIHGLFKDVNDGLMKLTSDADGVELAIANKLYANKSITITETFIKQSADFYGNTTDQMDFGANPDGCRKTINDWVEVQTKEKIKDLLPEGTVNAQTNLVLVNAIYFKGKWDKPFTAERTEKADFKVSASETVPVDMMHGELKIPFLTDEELKCSVVSIPYKSRGVSMVILLPDQVDGLGEIEAKLTPVKISAICNDLQTGLKGNVEIGLPKFSMTETSDLSSILPKLGVVDLFDASKADLSALTTEASVCLNDVIHKAHIEVNEEGTEAAAATAMISRMMHMPMENHTFICDKPFLFILMEQDSGVLLFIGRYAKPV